MAAGRIRREYLNADLFRIEPQIPYTDADLDYNDSDSRANQEMNDDASRPALAAEVENMAQYDTVILAFPIWWGQAPRLIETFIEAHDLSGKTVLTFCTSASSGYGRTGEILSALTDETVNWIEGARFSPDTTAEEMQPGLRKRAWSPTRLNKAKHRERPEEAMKYNDKYKIDPSERKQKYGSKADGWPRQPGANLRPNSRN